MTDKLEPQLVMTDEGLTLAAGDLRIRGDFKAMLPRLRKSNLDRELLVRAAKQRSATVIDATAGLGEDSILLAAAGLDVIMFEHNPVIAALLKDAMARAERIPELAPVIVRMQLIEGDSIEALTSFAEQRLFAAAGRPDANAAAGRPDANSGGPEEEPTHRDGGMSDAADPPDIVLLDPMFPARTKSALVKKKLQLIQMIEKPCADEEALLEAAIAAGPAKVIIKRPLKGPYLAGIKPTYSLSGKAIRYDVICPAPAMGSARAK